MASDLENVYVDKHLQGGSMHREDTSVKVLETSTKEKSSSKKQLHGKSVNHWVLLCASAFAVVFGASSATLLGRLYFVHGGTRRMLYTWTQSAGWPLMLLPLFISYKVKSVSPTRLTPKLLLIYGVMGILTAFDNLLYSWGLSFLPVSTNALLTSSQLAFTAVFAFLLVRKKLTPCVLNSVFIITMSAILLAVHGSTDRPAGTTQRQYNIGFIVTIGASALYALILTLTEMIYRRVVGKASFIVVLEVQTCISCGAAICSMIGMLIVGDFRAIHHESISFGLGPVVYAMVLAWSAVGWQLFFLGSASVIFLTSSLMACVVTTITIPIIPILAVFFFHEIFSALKAMSMLMAIWGFISYIYGGYLESKERIEVLQGDETPV